MRLIDADAIKLPRGFFESVDNVPKFYEWLNTLPTIDAVPVMRCADCKWWGLSEYNTFGIHVCKKFSGVRGESDYCSRAERSDNGET